MSIAAGMQSATSGEMVYKGKTWNPTSMIDANLQGISMILQEANTIPGITVAQNIFAGREKEFTSHGIVRIKKMIRAAQALLDKYEIGYIMQRIRLTDTILKIESLLSWFAALMKI